ncbi:hypothetical protein COCNU_12G001060 [Cocos nucifera]|uniref:Uncharacterized protein n=1 Tax=Cocos nucifera TaxID=13894 RepID=A0A8K0NAB2_COCNU|nr:hypothetical protein COCNU_12G001060 [Cocos nucifera]
MLISIEQSLNQRHGKALVAFARSEAPNGSMEFFDNQIFIGELALTNLALAKQLIEVAHDMMMLEKGFRAFANICQAWSNKVTTVTVEKITALKCLQATIDQEKEVVEQEKQEEEISQLRVELKSAYVDLESTLIELELTHKDLESVEWIIESQESQIRRKRCDVSWLRKECNGCIKELEEERKKLQSSKLESASAKEEAKSARTALSQIYENGLDVVGKIYSKLDLSRITILRSDDKDESTEAIAASTDDDCHGTYLDFWRSHLNTSHHRVDSD